MRIPKKLPVWNVYAISMSDDTPRTFNVFEHRRFTEDTIKNAKQHSDSLNEFKKQLRVDLFYYYGSKFEWEMLIAPLSSRNVKTMQVDVYQQVMLNFDIFADYCWSMLKPKKKQQTNQQVNT